MMQMITIIRNPISEKPKTKWSRVTNLPNVVLETKRVLPAYASISGNSKIKKTLIIA